MSAGVGDEIAIRVEGLCKRYGVVVALNGLNLTLRQGQYLTLFGPNGAGKTTLVKTIAGLVRPTSGRVEVDGMEGRQEPEKLRAKLGVISHASFLYDHMSAWENLAFYAKMYGVQEWRRRAEGLLSDMGLQEWKDSIVGTFSQGMTQRLAIARALVHDPEIILLDEPYAGLDRYAARLLRDLLERLRHGRRTILMTTHDLHAGLQSCDRVAVQVKGRIVFEAPVEQVDPARFEDEYLDLVMGA